MLHLAIPQSPSLFLGFMFIAKIKCQINALILRPEQLFWIIMYACDIWIHAPKKTPFSPPQEKTHTHMQHKIDEGQT